MEPYDPNKPKVSFNLPSKEEVFAAMLGLVPGGRAMYAEYKNPDISWKEYGDLVAEDVVPFYGTYRNDGDWRDYAKEAVMLGVPMPYIKHPVTGKPIPNNLKEAMKPATWAAGWENPNQ